MSPDAWYYVKSGSREKHGPISTQILTAMIKNGQLLDTDHVWQQGMPDWTPIREIKNPKGQARPAAPVAVGGRSTDPAPNGLGADAHGVPTDITVDFDLNESIADRHAYPEGGLVKVNGKSGKDWLHKELWKDADVGAAIEQYYKWFIIGVILLGGIIATPLLFALCTEMTYFSALPWSVGSSVVFLFCVGRDGKFNWAMGVPAIFVIVVSAKVYSLKTGEPSFAFGGILGFAFFFLCGFIGVGVGKLVE